MRIKSGFYCCYLLINLLIGCISEASCTKIGVIITPSDETDKTNYIDKINYIQDDVQKNGKSKDTENKISKLINSYFSQKHTCLRYYLHEFIKFNEKELSNEESILIAMEVNFRNLGDSKIQTINLNIFDNFGNILRRINNIDEKKIKLLIDFELNNKNDLELSNMNELFFDLCFENNKYDRSWNSKPETVEAYVEILFGLSEIKKNLEKSSLLIDVANENLKIIDKTINTINEQLLEHLKTSETQFRNKNEDTLTKFQIAVVIIVTIYIIANVFQIVWLLRYLKSKNLM